LGRLNRLIDKVADTIRALNVAKMKPLELAAIFRAAASVAAAASDAEAVGLGVEELLKTVGNKDSMQSYFRAKD
jgi:hypothetical protein